MVIILHDNNDIYQMVEGKEDEKTMACNHAMT